MGRWCLDCWAGAYLAGELLRAEGFTDVRYVQGDPKVDQSVWIARGDTDFSPNHPPLHIMSIDAGVPIKLLAGLHSGCFELIANVNVRSVADLRGKRVGVELLNSSEHTMLTLIAAYVGLDPAKDIQWIAERRNPARLFLEGKVDAFHRHATAAAGTARQENRPCDPQHDHRSPWSQQFCCMISAY